MARPSRRTHPQRPHLRPRQQTRRPISRRRPGSLPALALPAGGLGDGVVRLRAPRESDAHALVRGCNDPDVARWTKIPSPYTLEDARAWIALSALERERG